MQESSFEKFGETSSADSQEMIEQLYQQWQHAGEPTPEELKNMLELAIVLPDEYKKAALTAIADYLSSHLVLHFLQLMAVFCQKAEQEDIDLEEREACLQDVLSELFAKIIGINRDLSIRSLEDLSALSAITVNLQTLSRAKTAENARTWMYELPTLYSDELKKENLLSSIEYQIQESSVATNKHRTFLPFSRKAV